MNSSDLVMVGSYKYGLVALSILIAMLGSYAAIDPGKDLFNALQVPRGNALQNHGRWTLCQPI
jgi:NO-binding membrane sensor protein with MHYT domain